MKIYSSDNEGTQTNDIEAQKIIRAVEQDYMDNKIIDRPKSTIKNFDHKKDYISLFREISNFEEYKNYKENPEDNFELVFITTRSYGEDEAMVEVHVDSHSHLITSIYLVM